MSRLKWLTAILGTMALNDPALSCASESNLYLYVLAENGQGGAAPILLSGANRAKNGALYVNHGIQGGPVPLLAPGQPGSEPLVVPPDEDTLLSIELESSALLDTWLPLPVAQAMIGQGGGVRLPTGESATFYRLKSSTLEAALYTSPSELYSAVLNTEAEFDELFFMSDRLDYTENLVLAGHDTQSLNGGEIVTMENGRLLYSPPPGFIGLDSFRISLADGTLRYTNMVVNIIVSPVVDAAAARSEILNGVNYIARSGTPGPIAVWGNAFGIAQDVDHRPWVGGSSFGQGRVVAFGHNEFADFSRADVHLDDSNVLYSNVLAWVSRSSGKSIRIVTNVDQTKTWLEQQGYTDVQSGVDWLPLLEGSDVAVLALDRHLTDGQAVALRDFVAGGGGLVAAQIGWVLIHYGGYRLDQAPQNRLLRAVGLGWADGYSSSFSNVYACTEYGNATYAVAAVASDGPSLSTGSLQQAMSAATLATQILSIYDPAYTELVKPVLPLAELLVPSPTNLVTSEIDRFILRVESDFVSKLPLNYLAPHRTAGPVFGNLPGDVERITTTIQFETVTPGRDTRGASSSVWLSTGLYAAPGEIATVSVSGSVAALNGVYVKVGAEWDDVRHRPEYRRMPSSNSRDFMITAGNLAVANPYGGLIYVVVPKDTGLEPFSLTIENVVRAPFFILGETTNAEWNEAIRSYPAPWAELLADNVIITVRSDTIRNLDDPEGLMTFWEEGLRVQTEMAGLAGRRTRPERMHTMVETKVGYGYAGYPIGGREWNFSDYSSLLQGAGVWGPFHELGHLHQTTYWTDSRTGEMTVNLFAMRAIEQVVSTGRPSDGWSAQWDQSSRLALFSSATAKGGFAFASLEERLAMYSELRHAFGWEAIRSAFQSYHDDEDSAPHLLPTTDQEEWDQWLIRLSRAVGFDLSPYFISWNYGVSAQAVQSLADLPAWNHPDYGD